MTHHAKSAMLHNAPRFVFFGTPEFSATVLDGLVAAGMVPVAVVTNPDRPSGRKKIITASSVKLKTKNYSPRFARLASESERAGEAGKLKTVVLQPEKLDDAFIGELKGCGAAVGVLVAYGKIIPRAVFAVFPKGIVVVHPSLLPCYRGATPIQSAILAGDAMTGTTLFVMDEKVDHGSVLARASVEIMDSDTYTTLARKLAAASAHLLINTLPRYVSGAIVPQAQDESLATYTKKMSSADGFVDFAELVEAIHGTGLKKDAPEKIWRMVRALNPEPGVWCREGGRRKKILVADLKDGKLILKKIQFDGGQAQVV